MNKIIKSLTISTLSLLSIVLTSCGEEKSSLDNPYTLPDLYGKTLKQAKLECGANILFDSEVERIETRELIEDRILGYSGLKAGEKVEKGSRVKLKLATPKDETRLPDSNIVNYHSLITKLTGDGSLNDEVTKDAGIRGTDLGIPFELPDGKMMLLYGDSFSTHPMKGRWTSNFMAVTSDTDLSDGLTFDYIVSNENNGASIPFAEGAHQSGQQENTGTEVTKIPTGGISIGNDVYIFYMSIRYWGVGGEWLVSYSQCVKASDSTYKKWVDVPSLRWNEDELYYGAQIYPFNNPKDEEHIYFTSVPGGRNDGAIMFRVDKDKFENRAEYEYLVGKNEWVKGDTGMNRLNSNPYYILSPAVAEPSIAYNSYLDKFLFATYRNGKICLVTSDDVTGPYNNIYTVLESSQYSGLYGGFIHSKFMDSDDQRLYMQLSLWTPVYNTSLVEVVLK